MIFLRIPRYTSVIARYTIAQSPRLITKAPNTIAQSPSLIIKAPTSSPHKDPDSDDPERPCTRNPLKQQVS